MTQTTPITLTRGDYSVRAAMGRDGMIQHPPFVPRAQARVYRNITPNLAVWAIAR